jgi:hypothetical protein
MHTLVQYLRRQAQDRQQTNPNYIAPYVGVATRIDPALACKMQRVWDAQLELDTYILSRSEGK